MASYCNENENENNKECQNAIILRLPNFDLNKLAYWNVSWTKIGQIYGKCLKSIAPATITICSIFSTIYLFNDTHNCTITERIFFSAIFGPYIGLFTGGIFAISFPTIIPSWITLFFLTRK